MIKYGSPVNVEEVIEVKVKDQKEKEKSEHIKEKHEKEQHKGQIAQTESPSGEIVGPNEQ